MGDYEKAREHITAALTSQRTTAEVGGIDSGQDIAWSVDALTHAVLAVAFALIPEEEW